MNRPFLSVLRVGIPVVLACITLAAATLILKVPPSNSAWAALQKADLTPYNHVIVVAQSGGDFGSVQNALGSITDNSPANRYLIWVAPGTYTESVMMKQYVDIEGAGEQLTRILFGAGSTVIGASNAELRHLTVESVSSQYNAFSAGIYNDNTSPSLDHVTVLGSAYAKYGIFNTNGSSPRMTDVTVVVTGVSTPHHDVHGMKNEGNSSPKMRNVSVTVSGGFGNWAIRNQNSSPEMTNVTVSYSGGGVGGFGIANEGGSPTMRNVVVSSLSSIPGMLANGPGIANTNSSPEMVDVSVILGSPGVTGISNSGSSAKIVGGTITLTGGGSTGVSNYNSSARLNNVVITVSGSGWGSNTGVRNDLSSATIQNSSISVTGDGYGVRNTSSSGNYLVTVDNSTISASTGIIYNGVHHVTRVGASKLDGGPVLPNLGKIICAGVYDENYTFFPNTCP